MNDKEPQQSSDTKNSEMFQDLSHFIKLFKKMAKKIQIVAYNLNQKQNNSSLIQTIIQLINTNQQIFKKYLNQLNDDSYIINTYFRLIHRINQIILSMKNKLYNQGLLGEIIQRFINKLQQSYEQAKYFRNFGKLIQRIFDIFIKFCQLCLDYQKNDKIAFQFKESVQKKLSQDDHTKTKTKFNWSSTQSNFQKTLNKLNYRFYTIGCLDIDYNFFKTSYFSVRTDNQQFYSDYLKKNYFNKRQINLYSFQFRQYLQRKQKAKLTRKNRFINERNFSKTKKMSLLFYENSENDLNQINLTQKRNKDKTHFQTQKDISQTNNKISANKKQLSQENKKSLFLKLKNVTIKLHQQRYDNSIHQNRKLSKKEQDSRSKQKYQIIKCLKFPKKGSINTQPVEQLNFTKGQTHSSFLDIRHYSYQNHWSKPKKKNQLQSQQLQNIVLDQKTEPAIFKKTQLRKNILKNKSIRIAQFPSPIKRKSVSIKIITT